jgi:L-arabinokinase
LALAHKIAAAQASAMMDSSLGSPARIPSGTLISALTCMHPPQPRGSPSLLRYSAQPHRFVGPVRLPENVRILALDTGVRASPTMMAASGWGVNLEEFRTAAAMGFRIIETIYRDLGQHHTPLHGYLANTSPLLYRQYFRTLLPKRARAADFLHTYGALPDPIPASAEVDESRQPAKLYRVRTAVDHLIAEHEHAEQFLQAMEELAGVDAPPLDESERQRTLQRAGRLLLASHHSYRLRLELSCREADWLVDRLMDAGPDRGIYGARMTAAGAGGTVVALLDRSTASTDALLETIQLYNQWMGMTLGITEA